MAPHDLMARRVVAAVNAAVVLLVLAVVFVAFNRENMPRGLADFLALRITVKNLLIGMICLAGGALSFHAFGLTQLAAAQESFGHELLKVTKASTVTAAIALLFPITSQASSFADPRIYLFLPAAIIACMAGRLASRGFSKPLARAFDTPSSLIIVGSGPRASSLYKQVREAGHHRFKLLGFVDSAHADQITDDLRDCMLGTLDQLEEILMKQVVDRVLIALPGHSCHAQIQTALTTCERAGVEAHCFISDIFDLSIAKPKLEPEGRSSVIRMSVVHDDGRILIKRIIDVFGALLGLILLAPLMLLIALAIRLTSPGPPIFVQERYGLRKRRFRMYKFRTMVCEAEKLQHALESRNEAPGPVFKIRDDPRITAIGRFLRKTSLDELPQLFNILKGEMSLVGPRPLPLRDVSRFDKPSTMRRFSVKPGLTGLWQVSGRSELDFEKWLALDLAYIDKWSLGMDLKIILKTVPAIINTRGAF